jgi:adenine-specific DNA methylase
MDYGPMENIIKWKRRSQIIEIKSYKKKSLKSSYCKLQSANPRARPHVMLVVRNRLE